MLSLLVSGSSSIVCLFLLNLCQGSTKSMASKMGARTSSSANLCLWMIVEDKAPVVDHLTHLEIIDGFLINDKKYCRC